MQEAIKKELILINPPMGQSRLFQWFSALFHRVVLLPSLFILSGLTPPEYKIRIFNQKTFWRERDFPKGALVGITCVTPSANEAYRLASCYRRAGSYVVMGGPHVSALPQEALQYCDSVVVGEAESVWQQVIKDYEAGSLQKIYRGVPLEDFFSPVYDYFLRLPPRILRRSGLSLSRGCKYRCEFCACPSHWPRYIKIAQVVEIIRRMKEDRKMPFMDRLAPMYIFFRDEDIFSDPTYARKLFQALIPLKIQWGSFSSLSIAYDKEALVLARQSGCKFLFVGFETIYPQKLQKTAEHRLASYGDYFKAIRRIKQHGINLVGGFIVGFDYYTHLDYLKLLLFFLKSSILGRFFWASIAILTPFPGTPLFERLKKADRLTTINWDKYNFIFPPVFKPLNMSAFSLLSWFMIITFISYVFSTPSFIVICVMILFDAVRYAYIHYSAFLYGVPIFQ